MNDNVAVIGIVGGIASGKSVVAQRLAEWGAELLDADRAGHEVLDEPQVREKLVARWGRGILNADGSVNRRAVADVVFKKNLASGGETKSTELRFLEEVTHPRIRAKLEQRIQNSRAAHENTEKILVLDAPLLFEAQWNTLCDEILFVDAPREQRLQRSQRTRGWSAQEFARREAAQLDVDQKRQRADVVIDNSKDLETTFQQVDRWWQTRPGFAGRPRSSHPHGAPDKALTE